MENKADRTSRVLELRKGLEKGLDTGEFGAFDDILAELARTPVDVALLKATAVGVTVNRARKDARLSAAQSEAVRQILAKWKGAVQPTTPTAVEAAKTPKREPSAAAATATAGGAAKEPVTPSRSASNGAAAAAPAASPKASAPKASPKSASIAKSVSTAAALSKSASIAGAGGASAGLTGADAEKRARVQRVLFDALPPPPVVASAAAAAPTDTVPTAAANGVATASGSTAGASASSSTVSAAAVGATAAGAAAGASGKASALSGGAKVTREQLAAAIEAALYDVCGRKVSSEYSEKCRALKFNLSDPQNPDLSRALYRGGITAQRLVTMTAQELAPAALKVLRQKELKDAIDAARSDYDQANGLGESDMFQCEKCLTNRTQYKMQQTRGADEPMTVFVTCLNCGFKWRSGDNN